MGDLEYIKAHSSPESRYEMLAEEAVELAHAAQKYARMMRGEQPVSEDLGQVLVLANLREEIADVLLCIGATVCDFYDEDAHDTSLNTYLSTCAKRDIRKIYKEKKARWANRLREKEEKAKETEER